MKIFRGHVRHPLALKTTTFWCLLRNGFMFCRSIPISHAPLTGPILTNDSAIKSYYPHNRSLPALCRSSDQLLSADLPGDPIGPAPRSSFDDPQNGGGRTPQLKTETIRASQSANTFPLERTRQIAFLLQALTAL